MINEMNCEMISWTFSQESMSTTHIAKGANEDQCGQLSY